MSGKWILTIGIGLVVILAAVLIILILQVRMTADDAATNGTVPVGGNPTPAISNDVGQNAIPPTATTMPPDKNIKTNEWATKNVKENTEKVTIRVLSEIKRFEPVEVNLIAGKDYILEIIGGAEQHTFMLTTDLANYAVIAVIPARETVRIPISVPMSAKDDVLIFYSHLYQSAGMDGNIFVK